MNAAILPFRPVKSAGSRTGEQGTCCGITLRPGGVDDLHAELFGKELDEVAVGDQAEVDEDLSERDARIRLTRQRVLELAVDDEAAGDLATQHLIDIGCKRIAHIRGPETSPGSQRLQGYKRALERNGIPLRPEYVIAEPKGDVESRQRGGAAMLELLRLEPRPDGVFFFNDPLALGAMNFVLDQGLRIPEDVALIGCGDLHYDDTLRVPLSSINQRSRLIGEEAARVTLAILKSKKPLPVEKIVLQPELVVRASTQKRPN